MKIVLSIALLLLLQHAYAKVLRLTVQPAVASVALHIFSGLKEDVTQYTLHGGTAIIPMPAQEGLLMITLPEGQEFPFWAATTDTGYTMYLTPNNKVPQITGSIITKQLYEGMAVVTKLQQRRMALAETRRGLPDTALLAHIITTAQIRLDVETDSVYRYLQLHMGQVANVVLWGNGILPEAAAQLNGAGKEREAKANIIAFVIAHYAVVAKSNLLRNLINQYLLVTEAASIPPGAPSFENRTRADMAAWIKALQGKCSATVVTNYIIDYFLHHNMWTLCDTLMKNNTNASCPMPIVAKTAVAPQIMLHNNKGDSLNLLHPKEPILLALYDMDCPSAITEYVLMRRQLQEVYQPPVKTGIVLLHQDAPGFAAVWQGMTPVVYYNTGEGYNVLAALLPKNSNLPSYWLFTTGRPHYIGRSCHEVRNYFDQKKRAVKQ